MTSMMPLKIAGTRIDLGEPQNITLTGSHSRREAVEVLAAQASADGARVVIIDPVADRPGALAAVSFISDEARRRRETLAGAESSWSESGIEPLLIVVNHSKHIDDKGRRALISVARQSRRLGFTLLICDSVSSLPEGLSELIGLHLSTEDL